ncbi:asparagine-rich protein [Octopus bimaculoides]|uniref:Uncharacterized protein n=1 Tax=Octopus bimaculoides TaxID=37653 RepID=A0A0L8IBX2_OCTBM|nr:asparagine-rich protein [Octopus bimaculoides]|eukprot:XP_014778743.1 PREDICTED: asparagine-rich protein-like [Octopus bimaculoides]
MAYIQKLLETCVLMSMVIEVSFGRNFPLNNTNTLQLEAKLPEVISADSIPMKSTTYSGCSNYKANLTNPILYEVYVNGIWMTRRCALGSQFNQSLCSCSSFTKSKTDCVKELHINFDNGIKDISSSLQTIAIMNVNTEDGKGIFNGGKLTLWRYNGYSFPNGITFHLSYKRTDFTEGLQAIFMSCDENNHKANLGIMLNATSAAEDKVHIFVRPNRRNTELVFASQKSDWNDVYFLFNKYYLNATVNHETKSIKVSEQNMQTGGYNILFGACAPLKPFIGYMDDISLYTCIPREAK